MSTEAELTANSLNTTLVDQTLEQDTVAFPHVSQKRLALKDIIDGVMQWRIWYMLSYQDIKLRYRRSVLGPFWITISMAITVYTMGFLYGHLFQMDLAHYYPFLVAGMVSWSLISSVIIEYTDGFSDGLIKQIKLPYSLFTHRIACRNLFIFFHNLLVMLPIYILFHETTKINFQFLLIIPGLLILYVNAIFYGLILSMIGARYRDISQVIKSLVQVIFFITPVMWGPAALHGKHQYILDYNPFYSFLECIRAPLLGTAPTLKNLAMVLFMTVLGILICSKMFSRYRARIVYWL